MLGKFREEPRNATELLDDENLLIHRNTHIHSLGCGNVNQVLSAHIEEVVVFPMSGYINRLQTIASAAILADQLGAQLRICWIPFHLAPSLAEAVFSKNFCDEFLIAEDLARNEFLLDVDRIPLYVNQSAQGVSLRGADKGEQALMAELEQAIQSGASRVLAIVSGGSFHRDVPGYSFEAFRQEKSNFYRALRLHPEIERSVNEMLGIHSAPYLGLHLRYTDRSSQAPLDRSIRKALTSQSKATGISSILVAADSVQSRDRWVSECRTLGLEPWYIDHSTMKREDPLSAHPALIDWKLLGHASRLVYFTASSFAVEAAVMSGSWRESTGLDPHLLRAGYVHLSEYARHGFRHLRGISR